MSQSEKALQRALLASAAAAGCVITVTAIDWTRWSTATFSGARHTMTLSGSASPSLQEWLALLPDADLRLGGHLLADLMVEALPVEHGAIVTLHALTLEER